MSIEGKDSCEECSHQDMCGLKLELEQLWESDMASLVWDVKKREEFYCYVASNVCVRFESYH